MTDAVPAERDTPFTRHKALFYTLRVLRECVPSLVLCSSLYFLFVKSQMSARFLLFSLKP